MSNDNVVIHVNFRSRPLSAEQDESMARRAARKILGRQRLSEASTAKAVDIGKAQVALRDAIARLVSADSPAGMLEYADASLMPFRDRELHK